MEDVTICFVGRLEDAGTSCKFIAHYTRALLMKFALSVVGNALVTQADINPSVRTSVPHGAGVAEL